MAEKVTLFEIDINVDAAVKDSKALAEEIQVLKAQAKLAKEEQGELSEEYIKYTAAIKSTQKELRVNNKLIEDSITADQEKEGSIKQLRTQLSIVSVEWAKLSADERENTERGIQLTKQKTELTAALTKEEKATGDSRREVGKYAKGILEAIDTLQKQEAELQKNRKALIGYSKSTKLSKEEQADLKNELVLVDAKLAETGEELEDLGGGADDAGGLFGGFSEQLGELDNSTGGVIGQVKALGKQFLALLTNPIVAIIAAIVAGITLLVSSFKKTQDGADTFAKAFDAVGASIDAIIGRIAGLAGNIKDLITGKKSLKEFKDTAKDTFKGIQEEIKDTVKESNKLFDMKKALELAEIASLGFLASLEKVAAKQGAIADDATLSFQERQKAAEKAEKAEIAARQEELKLARQALKLITDQNKLKKQQKLLTDDLRKAEAELAAAVILAESTLEVTRIEQSKRRAELAQDDFEQQLDFLLDIADVEKTLNEEKIADDDIAFERRVEIFEETKDLINESFDLQIKLFEQENDLNIDRDKLLKLNNAQIFEYARGLGLSEIETNRLKEVIVERRKAQQDLVNTEKDLNDERIENEKKHEENRIKLAEEGVQADLDRLNFLQEEELKFLNDRQQAESDNIFAILDLQKEKLAIQFDREIEAAERVGSDTTAIKDKYAKIQDDIDNAEFNTKLSLASDFASNVAEIFGEQSKVGKAAAIVSTTISTFQAAVSAYASLAPIPLVGPGLGIAAAAAAVAYGFKQVQAITNTNTDGVKTGNATVPSSGSAPPDATFNTAPRRPPLDGTSTSDGEIGLGIASRSRGVEPDGSEATVAVVVDEVTEKQETQNSNRSLAAI